MNTTKVPVDCWYCESEYDYTKHEVCPICERHWLDAKYKDAPPESGTRVSVHVDHVNNRLRTIPALLLALLLLIGGCTPYSCPTYSLTPKQEDEIRATFNKPDSIQVAYRDSVAAERRYHNTTLNISLGVLALWTGLYLTYE